MTFAVTNNEAGEHGKQEILDLINDDSTANFVYQEHSYGELIAAREDICEYLFNLGISFSGIFNQEENKVVMTVGTDSQDIKDLLTTYCTDKYGDMIVLEFDLQAGSTDDNMHDQNGPIPPNIAIFDSFQWVVIGIGVISVVGMIAFIKVRRK